MTYHDYKVNKQAIRDLSEGKQTDAVKEFLKRYEIRPRENKKEQSVNQKETTAMADKETQPQEPLQQSEVQQAAQQQQQPQAQQAAQESQGPRYRYNENMVNWEELEKVGISKASLEQQGLLDSMLKGYKTNKLVTPDHPSFRFADSQTGCKALTHPATGRTGGTCHSRHTQGTAVGTSLFRV